MSCGEWTTKEVALLVDMKRRGLTTYAIARLLGRTEGSVRGCVARHGAVSRPRWDECEVRYLMDNYGTLGAVGCAESLRRTPKAVSDKARRLGIGGGRR